MKLQKPIEPPRHQGHQENQEDDLWFLPTKFLSVFIRASKLDCSFRARVHLWLIVFCLSLSLVSPVFGKDDPPSTKDWTFKKYLKAFKKSGRPTRLTSSEFERVQARKEAYLKDIHRYLWRKFGYADPRIMKAFQDLPREYFHYDYQGGVDFSKTAYEYPPRTWALGWGSALSDYEGQAYMAQLAHPRPGDTVLEIGTGSGFNVSLLSRLVKDAYSIEIIKPLGTDVSHIFKPLGLKNVHTRVGDGYYGWKEVKGGFDIIMFTCVAQFVPPTLFRQLKPGGRIIIPIGQPFKHNQVLYVYRMDRRGRVHSKKYIPVYFIPMKGTMGVAAAQMGITVPGVKKAKPPKIKPTPNPTPSPKKKSDPKATHKAVPDNKKALPAFSRDRASLVP